MTKKTEETKTVETVSLCLIAKDEEKFLGRCLESAKPAVDEMIVVDTGSKDNTKIIAREYNATVIDHAWRDNFSDARNRALEEARCDWILQLDADEVLEEGAAEAIKTAINGNKHEALMMTIVNLTGPNEAEAQQQTFPSIRLFRNRPERRYRGAFHEQIEIDESQGKVIEIVDARIRHLGYLDPVVDERRKRQRNAQLAEDSGWDGTYDMFIKANEDYANGRFKEALARYIEVFEEASVEEPMYLSSVLMRLVVCHRELNENDRAITWAEKGLKQWPNYTDLEYLLGLTLLEKDDLDGALRAFVACTFMGEAPSQFDTTAGVGSWSAMQGVAMVYEKLGRLDIAVHAFRQALAFNNRATVSAAHLARIYLANGFDPIEVKHSMIAIIDHESVEMQKMLDSVFKSDDSGPLPECAE